jgi:peroxiredoxin
MALTPSNMPELGLPAPEFSLPATGGKLVSPDDLAGDAGLLVAFWCNHCPFVRHINEQFASFAAEYQPRGLAIVAISANDVANHPEDSPDNMRRMAEQSGYVFPYLYDETQDVARAYDAACTPDFFLYDAGRRLIYRGRFDAATPGNDIPVTGDELRTAVDALLEGRPVSPEQNPSIGCNIKWRAG